MASAVAAGLSQIDLRFRRSQRRAEARRRRPVRRHPLAWRSVYASVLALAVLAVAAESTRIEGSSAKARPSAAQPAKPALFPACPVPVAYRAAFQTAAARTRVPTSLLVATAYEESRMDPNALSGAGARGLLQVMPATARELGAGEDTAANILAGARYLHRQLDRFGDLDLALAAYNAGPTVIDRAGHAPIVSLRYAKNVEARAALLRAC